MALPPAENRLGLLFYFDTNFVGDESTAVEELRSLHRAGWLNLQRTDTVATELGGAKDQKRREELLEESGGYFESLGPIVLGHSRLGSAVLGAGDDEDRLDRVYRILFPGSDRHDESTGRASRKVRDAMHVATAIRYCSNVFVTRDQTDLLSKSDAVAVAFNGFKIMTPEDALAFALRMKERYEYREQHPLAGSPGSIDVPPAVVAVAAGRPIRPVWRNQLGGLTFEIDPGPDREFVKWVPTGCPIDLKGEADRLRWAAEFTTVPDVLALGSQVAVVESCAPAGAY